MFKFTTKKLVRAGIIAALYTAITYALAPYAYGPLQIRPAEALCILPIFYTEAIPGLFVGCALANIFSAYGVYDVVFGSLTTLIAAILTFVIGRAFKEKPLGAIIGGFFPIVLNAFAIPLIIALTGAGMETYLVFVGEFLNFPYKMRETQGYGFAVKIAVKTYQIGFNGFVVNIESGFCAVIYYGFVLYAVYHGITRVNAFL